MGSDTNVGGRDRLVRGLLAAVLSVVAVRALSRGNRLRGLLAGVGALGLGFNATTGYCGANDALGIDTTRDTSSDTAPAEADTPTADTTPSPTEPETELRPSARLSCAACGDPIRVGQPRGPNEDDQIVHRACA